MPLLNNKKTNQSYVTQANIQLSYNAILSGPKNTEHLALHSTENAVYTQMF